MRIAQPARSFILASAAAVLLGYPQAAAQTAVKFPLTMKIDGAAAPFLVPIDRGFYKAEQLEVDIAPPPVAANTASDPLARVASGAADFGVVDINALIRHRSQNASTNVKAVFVLYNKASFAIIARKSRNITKPKDLEEKKLGAPASDAAFAQWKLFAKVNDIDTSKVTIDNIGVAVREPMLAAGQVDAVTGSSFSTLIDLKDRGVPAEDILVMRMADYGVQLYGQAVIVNEKFAAEHPETVKALLRAFTRGLREVLRDPARAIESITKRNENARKDLELERLRLAIRENIATPEVKARGLGDIDAARLEADIEQMASAQEIKAKPKVGDIFDPAFLPPLADRRLP